MRVEGTADLVGLLVGQALVVHVRDNEVLHATICGAAGSCNSGRRTCGNHVRRTNGVEMVETPWLDPGTFDPGTFGYDACVPWHVPQLRPEGAPPGGAVASARLVAGPVVEGLPDGQAALGAVEVVGLRPGRQEWSYCPPNNW